MNDRDITIFIPVKNEVVGLSYLVKDYQENILGEEKLSKRISFIFIIDGRTTDESKIKATKILEMNGQISSKNQIIDQKDTHGKGAAIGQAIDLWKKAPSSFVFFLDADGSHSFLDIRAILEELNNGSDVVSGSRFMSHSNLIDNTHFNDMSQMGKLHIFGNKLLSKISSLKNKRKITDLCTGIWGFKSNALIKLNLRSEGFDLEAEIAGKCRRNDLIHSEVPIHWYPRKGGSSKLRSFRDGFIILIEY
jgi:hypothetical protein